MRASACPYSNTTSKIPYWLHVSERRSGVWRSVSGQPHPLVTQQLTALAVDRQVHELKDGFAWENFRGGKIVDIGGASGHASIWLARVSTLIVPLF